MWNLNQPDTAARSSTEHRLMYEVGLSGFFKWDPSAAVSREPSVPASGLHQRLTSNVVLQGLARVAPAHAACGRTSYTA